MIRVRITGWESGFKRVEHIALIREHIGLTLKPAKELNDRILSGETVTVGLSTPEAAEEFARESRELGAVTEVEHQASRAR